MRQGLVVLALALSAACTVQQPETVAAQEDGDIAAGGISPFDNDHPAIRNLDPQVREAVQQAARAAEAKGIKVKVTSGWRSKQYQERLLAQGIQKYGSLAEARKFVNTPDKSTHVTGRAVDIGPTDAADWFGRKGAEHGLCQTYANEMWHFELATTPGGECPPQRGNAAG